MDLSLLFEDYHRKKWFPDKYPDPFGELIDSINDEAAEQLLNQWKKTGDRRKLHLSRSIVDLIPQISFREIAADLKRVYSRELESGIKPQFIYYYLRSLSSDRRNEIWLKFKDWCGESRPVLLEWHRKKRSVEIKHQSILQEFNNISGIEADQTVAELERWLTGTRDLFAWELKTITPETDLLQILPAFRLIQWDEVLDWNDFKSLSNHFLESARIKHSPVLRRSNQDAIQFCFPIDPPSRITVEYGSAAGPIDSMRFLNEYAKGCFYKGVPSDLAPEYRIIGDPAVPEFWGYLYSTQLAAKEGARRFLNIAAEDLAPKFRIYFELWIRIDAALAIYKHRLESDLKNSQDLYVACRELILPGNIPFFMDLFELDQAANSIPRALAAQAALAATIQLQTSYGSEWFASERCSARIRDYWNEGTSITLPQILSDLSVQLDSSYNLNWSER